VTDTIARIGVSTRILEEMSASREKAQKARRVPICPLALVGALELGAFALDSWTIQRARYVQEVIQAGDIAPAAYTAPFLRLHGFLDSYPVAAMALALILVGLPCGLIGVL